MPNIVLSAVAALAMALGLLAVIELPELTFVLSFAGVGAIVGQCVAAYRAERNPKVNTTRIIALWTIVGAVVGVVALIVDALA